MSDDTGQFDVGKLRGNRVLLPLAIIIPLLLAAIAWGTTQNRVANLEQQSLESKAERERIEQHIAADDRQIAVLEDRLQVILDQLTSLNRKLDRAEDERHK